MPIRVNVESQFDDDSAAKAKAEADAYYKDKAAKIKVKTEFDEAAARATDAEVKRYFETKSAKIKVETDIDKDSVSRATRDAGILGTTIGKEFARGFGGAFTDLSQGFRGGLTSPIGLSAITALAPSLIEIAQGALTASQSIALLPAAAGAAGAAIGTLQLATSGFDDALKNMEDPKKFAAALQELSPNAQQAALSIQNLLPEFDQLKAATQDSFFAGIGEEIHKLVNEYLPEVKSLTTSIANSFNQALKGVGEQFLSSDTQVQMQNFMNNISTAFQNLVPAAQSFAQAIVDIGTTGSNLLPGLAQDAADVARNFADFIRQARDSGQLQEFIQNGIDALKVFGEALLNIGKILYQTFGADGAQNVQNLKFQLDDLTHAVGILGDGFKAVQSNGRSALTEIKQEIADCTGPAGALRDAILDIPEALTLVGNKAIDMANTVVHALNWMSNNVNNFFNSLNPFGDKTFNPTPDIPHLPSSWGGDWGSGAAPWSGGGGGGFRTGGRGGSPDQPSNTTPNAGLGPYGGPFAVPPPPPAGGGSGAGGGGIGTAQVPFGAGYAGAPFAGETASQYGAQTSYFDAQNRTLQAQAQLQRVQADSASTTDQLTKAQNDYLKAQRDEYDAQLRLSESFKQTTTQANTASTTMTNFGNQLEKDLGLSRGLPGLAENLFKFLGNLAAAPLLGPLNAISQAQGGIGKTGSGLIGIAAAQGAFGEQFTPAGQAAAAAAGGGGGAFSMPRVTLPGGFSSVADVTSGGNRLKALYALATSLEGTPYSTQLRNDCSGIMNELVNAAVGLPLPTAGQRFSTPNEGAFLQSHGFQEGIGPPGSFRIGVNPAAGMAGHTAGTLPGGENVEQGGSTSGFTMGPGAAGANSPQFSQHYFLPMQLPGFDQGGAIGPYDPNRGNFNPDMKIDLSRISVEKPPGGLNYPPWAFPGGMGWTPGQYRPQRNPLDALQSATEYGGGTPIIAHGGEHVLTVDDVKAMGGQGGVYNFRSALHMAGGGPIPEEPPHVPPPPPPPPPHAPGSGAGAKLSGSGASPDQPTTPHLGTGAAPGPTPIGGKEKPTPPSSSAGAGGGIVGAATSAAAMGADLFAPGSGAAIQILSQEAQRAIKAGSQAAGAITGGLLDTFLPTGGSDLANNNWITRIAGGFAGVQPQIPNLAGKSASVDAMQQKTADPMALPTPISSGQGTGRAPGPQVINNITYTNNGKANDPNIGHVGDALQRQYENIPGQR